MLSKKDQIKSNRLRPVEDIDLFDKDTTVRFDKVEYKKRQDFVLSLETCQVCDNNYILDAPHHAKYGLGTKDDRYLINVCIDCHREIHVLGYSNLSKTREQLEDIGWQNHLDYLEFK